MTPDLEIISTKISQLAELLSELRKENADLRLRIAALSSDNAELSKKINTARERVSALLAKCSPEDPLR